MLHKQTIFKILGFILSLVENKFRTRKQSDIIYIYINKLYINK